MYVYTIGTDGTKIGCVNYNIMWFIAIKIHKANYCHDKCFISDFCTEISGNGRWIAIMIDRVMHSIISRMLYIMWHNTFYML